MDADWLDPDDAGDRVRHVANRLAELAAYVGDAWPSGQLPQDLSDVIGRLEEAVRHSEDLCCRVLGRPSRDEELIELLQAPHSSVAVRCGGCGRQVAEAKGDAYIVNQEEMLPSEIVVSCKCGEVWANQEIREAVRTARQISRRTAKLGPHGPGTSVTGAL